MLSHFRPRRRTSTIAPSTSGSQLKIPSRWTVLLHLLGVLHRQWNMKGLPVKTF